MKHIAFYKKYVSITEGARPHSLAVRTRSHVHAHPHTRTHTYARLRTRPREHTAATERTLDILPKENTI